MLARGSIFSMDTYSPRLSLPCPLSSPHPPLSQNKAKGSAYSSGTAVAQKSPSIEAVGKAIGPGLSVVAEGAERRKDRARRSGRSFADPHVCIQYMRSFINNQCHYYYLQLFIYTYIQLAKD